MFDIQDLQSGSVRECKDHRSSRKVSKDVNKLVKHMSVPGTSKRPRDRNAKRLHSADEKTMRKTANLWPSGHKQPAGSVARALPLKLSRRAAHVRHVLIGTSSTAPSSHCTAQTSRIGASLPGAERQDHADNGGEFFSLQPDWTCAHSGKEFPTYNLQPEGAEWKGTQKSHPANTQSGQNVCQAVTLHTSDQPNLASILPVLAQTSSCHQTMDNQNGGDSASSNIQPSELPEVLGQVAVTNSSEQPGMCRTADAVSNQNPSAGQCLPQALLLSTVEAVDGAQSTMLAENDLQHQIVTGSVPGVPTQTSCD